jgi:UDP-N-acetylglucosamine 2-epimerase (non-hydrolysing)
VYLTFPEEMNRCATNVVETHHFNPTNDNKIYLLNCGVKEEHIFVTGNIVIGAFQMVIQDDYVFFVPLLKDLELLLKLLKREEEFFLIIMDNMTI